MTTIPLPNTGERFIPEIQRASLDNILEHWHRYLFANIFTEEKLVLDIACGEGYGSFLMSQKAKRVIGIDISEEVISHAQNTYISNNLEFREGSVIDIPVNKDNSIDVIVCFEAIEHISAKQQKKFLKEIKRVLKEDGLFIVSSPDKLIYSDVANYKNKYHQKEFYKEEFLFFLKQYFNSVDILGQSIYHSSYISGLNHESKNFREFHIGYSSNKSIEPIDVSKKDEYMIAICSKQQLYYPQYSLLFDPIEKKGEYDFIRSILYIDTGRGFNETEAITVFERVGKSNIFTINYKLNNYDSIVALRYDPHNSPISLKIHSISLNIDNTIINNIKYTTNKTLIVDDYFIFDHHDSQLYLEISNYPKPEEISFQIEIKKLNKEELKNLIRDAKIPLKTGNLSTVDTNSFSNSLGTVFLKQEDNNLSFVDDQFLTNKIDELKKIITQKENKNQNLNEINQKLKQKEYKTKLLLDERVQEIFYLNNTVLKEKDEAYLTLKTLYDEIIEKLKKKDQIIYNKNSQIEELKEKNKELIVLRDYKRKLQYLLEKSVKQKLYLENIVLPRKEADLDEIKQEKNSLNLLLDYQIKEFFQVNNNLKSKELELESSEEIISNNLKIIKKLKTTKKLQELKIYNKEKKILSLKKRTVTLDILLDRHIQESLVAAKLINSFSYRLINTFFFPFNKIINFLRKFKKNSFWFRFISIGLSRPFSLIKKINLKNFRILYSAIKHERKEVIITNFIRLLSK